MTRTAAASAFLVAPSVWRSPPQIHRVVIMSDIHIGRIADDLDGGEWLARGLDDLERHVPPIQYGLTLGDITHHGDRKSLLKYMTIRDQGCIPRWFELAGNHEHHRQGTGNYEELVRSTAPYLHIDGNIAWFLVSDEDRNGSGQISDKSYEWLEKNIARHENKIIILCTHQLPPNTIRSSDRDVFCLHPKDRIAALLSSAPITLSLCGHEHHSPYSNENMLRQGQTTIINAASMTHAYGTKNSHSLMIELVEGSKQIKVWHRNHDENKFQDEFKVTVPLTKRIRLASDDRRHAENDEK